MFHREAEGVELPAADVEDLIGVDGRRGVITAQDLALVGQPLVTAAGLDLVAAFLEDRPHLLEFVHVLGRGDEADRSVLRGSRQFLVDCPFDDGVDGDVREEWHVEDLLGVLHRRVPEVDEDVRPPHEFGVEVTGTVARLAGEEDVDAVGEFGPEVVRDGGAPPFEALGELEADGVGLPLPGLGDDPVEFVVPLPVVLEGHAGVPEVPLGVLVGRVLAHYATRRRRTWITSAFWIASWALSSHPTPR